VRSILANPRYTGRQVWNRQPTSHELIDPANTGLGHRQVQRWALPDGWVISAQPAHPTLVSGEDFIAVQGIRAERASSTAAGRKYLLAGLLRCGICGRRMESCWANSRPAYRCRHGNSSATTPDPARPKNTYVREDHIMPHLPALLANGEPPAGRRRRRTRHGVQVLRPVSEQDVVGCLRASETTLTYDPRTKTLQADTPEAVATVTGRAS
jgi:site-specific DNA recombinase